jgi:hypothetical protein
MVNARLSVELASEARGGIAVLDAQLATGAVAVGVHGSLGHAELAGDLLGRQMLIHQAQAFALARGEQAHRIFGNDIARAHGAAS